MSYWSVVMTQPRSEEVALTNLEQQGYVCYCPMASRQRVIKGQVVHELVPLFPRYIFVQITDGRWYSIKGTRGVIYILTDHDRPAKLSDSVIEAMKLSEIELAKPKVKEPKFRKGQQVKVVSGTFAGQIGIYDESSAQDRERVLLNLLGRKTTVVLKAEDLSSA